MSKGRIFNILLRVKVVLCPILFRKCTQPNYNKVHNKILEISFYRLNKIGNRLIINNKFQIWPSYWKTADDCYKSDFIILRSGKNNMKSPFR